MSSSSMPHDRRAFLGRAATAAAVAATGLGAAPASLLAAAAAPTPAPSTGKPDDSWLDGLKGKHRQIFDMPQPAGGLPMIHVRNFIDTYRSAYGVAYPEVNAVVGLYGFTVPLALTDDLWAKYQLGKAIGQVDEETKAPAVRNVFWKPRGDAPTIPVAGGPILPPRDTAITELQKRGALYIVCNNAMNFWAGKLAGATSQTPAAVRAEMDAHLVPGVVVVPAMVIAIGKAQERGLTYMFLP